MGIVSIFGLIITSLFVFMIFYLTKEPRSEDENKLKTMVQKRKRSKVYVKNGFIVSIIYIILFRIIMDYINTKGFFDQNGFDSFFMFGRVIGNIISIVLISFIISLIVNFFKNQENTENESWKSKQR